MSNQPTTVAVNTIDQRLFRSTMGCFATGVTVITTARDGYVHGMTANAFLSVSLDPPLVLVSIGRSAKMHSLLAPGGRYGVSKLSEEQEHLSRHFSGKPITDLQPQFVWHNETPLLADALAHVVARVVDVHPAGDHTLFIGLVEHLAYRDGRPLLYYRGRYGRMATL
ncbi:MAG: flavin oxidoreductase [Chloroflexus sp.]|jgi:flavin reductase (DIM6/NTAB) family NADH-FMN oxidoreductase RutF|uniref:flavin reductase family protein n=1 Tax=Chloroflexus sp. TaxID=1904827 RepID=UPI0021DE4A9F|nr:flavin reductase family protein [Chloroflexus sp.]GIV88815.1 MAG: flavin oxidoreductase [Chloroflexus sp.]